MIKFSHSVFALPFALASVALATVDHALSWTQVFWIVVAMVGARSAAMGFNRLVDRDVDALNPRTKFRELPSGVITPGTVRLFILGASLLFMFAAYNLNRLCFLLSPVALIIVFLYSYMKRYTWASHFILGLSLGIAPAGAWIAVTGTLDPAPMLLTLTVLTWVAGFDIIYACQDFEFDVSHGLFSLPQRLGVSRALTLSRVLHVLTVAGMLSIALAFDLSVVYLIGVGLVTGFLIYEHTLVRSDDLSRINVAFFTANGLISLVYFFFTLGDVLIRS
jgi:4-hydroxybenzoate polyprenyltransferase